MNHRCRREYLSLGSLAVECISSRALDKTDPTSASEGVGIIGASAAASVTLWSGKLRAEVGGSVECLDLNLFSRFGSLTPSESLRWQ